MQRFFLLVLLFCCIQSEAQKTDRKLQQKITHLIQNFKGDIGIYVHDLKKTKLLL